MALQNDENNRIGCILLVLNLAGIMVFPSVGGIDRGPGLGMRPSPSGEIVPSRPGYMRRVIYFCVSIVI